MGKVNNFFKMFSGAMRCRIGLTKAPLCLLIGCSTIFGNILANPLIDLDTFSVGMAIFILATGAATLNSLQEYRLDGALLRTRSRPLPKGLIEPRQAGLQAMVLLSAGLLMLFATTNLALPLLTAISAVLLYNGVYTPLKKKTILAIIPGAMSGALPPYIGWLSGGGGPFSYPATLLIVLFILWQVPHFWLILLHFKDDYSKGSLPHLLQHFSENSVKRFFVTWIGALVVVMLMFLGLPFELGLFFWAIIVFNGCLLLAAFIFGMALRKTCNYQALFITLNVTLFIHMFALAAGRVVSA